MKKKLKDFVACLSLSIIIICGPWLNNLGAHNSHFHLDTIRLSVFQFFITILILALIYFLLIQKCLFSKNKSIRYLAYSFFIISFIFFFRALLKILYYQMKPIIYITFTLISIFLIMTLIILFYNNPKTIKKTITIFFVIFFPFSILIFSKMSSGFFASKTNVSSFKNDKPKVVWIVFDEWDQYLTFVNRDKNLKLNELDNLKQNYFYASKVYQPANMTPLSLSSYLIGTTPKSIYVKAHDKILLQFDDKKSKSWKELPSIFSKLKKENVNSAFIGWALPFDRLYDKYLIKKKYYTYNHMIFKAIKQKYADMFLFYFLRPLNKLTMQKIKWLKNNIIKIVRQQGSQLYKEILAYSKCIIIDPKINFSLIHFSIPHPPIIYDNKKQKISTKINSYTDQLMLVDKTIKDIKDILIQDGSWDKTTLILTSDHWFRNDGWKHPIFHEHITITDKEQEMLKNRKDNIIPLIIKMPYQKKAISYDKPFNAMALHYLILDIYNNKVYDEQTLVSWLDNLEDKLKKPNQDVSCAHFFK